MLGSGWPEMRVANRVLHDAGAADRRKRPTRVAPGIVDRAGTPAYTPSQVKSGKNAADGRSVRHLRARGVVRPLPPLSGTTAPAGRRNSRAGRRSGSGNPERAGRARG